MVELKEFHVYHLIIPKERGIQEIPFIPSLTTTKHDLMVTGNTVKPYDTLVFIQRTQVKTRGFLTEQQQEEGDEDRLLEFYLPSKGFYGYFPSAFLCYLQRLYAPAISDKVLAQWVRLQTKKS